MTKGLKDIIIVILIILAIATSAGVFNLKQKAISKRINTEDTFLKEKIDKKKTEEVLSDIQKDTEGLKRNLDRLTQEAETLERELSNQKSDMESLKRRSASFDNNIAATKRKLSDSNSNIKELKNRIANVVKDTLGLAEELSLAQKTADAMQRKLLECASEPSAAEAVDFDSEQEPPALSVAKKKPAQPNSPGAFSGEVLTVNNEFDFIVISLGRKNNVSEGMIFDIYRDNKKIAQARLETVRENISAANITDKDMAFSIRAGDKAYSSQ